MPEFHESTTTRIRVKGSDTGALVLDDAFTRDVLAKVKWSGKYPHGRLRGKIVYLHHLVYQHYHGEVPSGLILDHIDRNTLNNLPGNLRAVSHRISSANRGLFRTNRSGYRGVWHDKRRNHYQANVGTHYLGSYATPEEAAEVVNGAYYVLFRGVPLPNPTVGMRNPLVRRRRR